MALPKLETPVYTLTLPSTDEEIKYRPFLVPVSIDLDDIYVGMVEEHTNEIQLTPEIKIVFKYPLLDTFTKYTSGSDNTKMIFDLTADCIEEVHFKEEITHKVDMSKKDLDEFIESLSTEQFTRLAKFFETMPRLRHRIEVTNPKTEVTSEVMLEGIESFLV